MSGPRTLSSATRRVGEESFPADVLVTEPLGEEMIVDIKIPKNKLKLKTSVDKDIKAGDKIWLDPMKNKMHLFNRKTEKAYF